MLLVRATRMTSVTITGDRELRQPPTTTEPGQKHSCQQQYCTASVICRCRFRSANASKLLVHWNIRDVIVKQHTYVMPYKCLLHIEPLENLTSDRSVSEPTTGKLTAIVTPGTPGAHQRLGHATCTDQTQTHTDAG